MPKVEEWPSPHRAVFGIGAFLIATHAYLVPERFQLYSYDLIELFVLVSMIWAVRRGRPENPRAWWLMTTGLGLLVVGDLIFNWLTRVKARRCTRRSPTASPWRATSSSRGA